jgi:hypothetical protein
MSVLGGFYAVHIAFVSKFCKNAPLSCGWLGLLRWMLNEFSRPNCGSSGFLRNVETIHFEKDHFNNNECENLATYTLGSRLCTSKFC